MAMSRRSELSTLVAPAAAVAVVGMMILPIPPLLIDILLAADIGMAMTLMLTAIYIRRPVEFSVLPSLLLLLTMLRLALNIASTRLILLHGHEGIDAAGHVIMAFGQFVVGGNYIVGVVVFLVLIAIQYVVINHGAVRISEVTARFTLDAMPGRQMAIDADLNAGVIDEKEAGLRRERVRREADFYGAMDGSIRFTQRDAMAAMLITVINIVAGLIIGVVQHNLEIADAVKTYTILTVGEGLVTAIPALLVSMSGGLITTRAGTDSELGEDVSVQLLHQTRPMAVASGALVALALVPGLPKLSFLFMAGVLGFAARTMRKTTVEDDVPDMAPPPPVSDGLDAALSVDPLGVEVGYALIALVDEKQGGSLLTRIRAIRRQIATDTGMVVPPVHVADNLQLGPRVYSVLVKGVEVARGELYPERFLAINPGTATGTIEGIATREPAFGLPAWWIGADQRERVSALGYTVVDPTTALSTHLSEVVRSFLPELLGRQQTKEMVDRVADRAPKLIEELVPKVVSIGDVQRVLRQLLRERVPIRDLQSILESLADIAPLTKDTDAMVESVRMSLGRAICRVHQSEKGDLPAISFAPSLEERLLGSIVRTEQGSVLALDPTEAQGIAARIARAIETAVAQPVLLCSPALRPHLWRLFSRVLPQIGVLSHNEVPAHVKVTPIAVLD